MLSNAEIIQLAMELRGLTFSIGEEDPYTRYFTCFLTYPDGNVLEMELAAQFLMDGTLAHTLGSVTDPTAQLLLEANK